MGVQKDHKRPTQFVKLSRLLQSVLPFCLSPHFVVLQHVYWKPYTMSALCRNYWATRTSTSHPPTTSAPIQNLLCRKTGKSFRRIDHLRCHIRPASGNSPRLPPSRRTGGWRPNPLEPLPGVCMRGDPVGRYSERSHYGLPARRPVSHRHVRPEAGRSIGIPGRVQADSHECAWYGHLRADASPGKIGSLVFHRSRSTDSR